MSIRRLQRHRVTRGKSFLERKTQSLLNWFKKYNENNKNNENKGISGFISSAETKIKAYSHTDKNSRATSRIYNKLNTIERSLLRTINKITDKLEESGGDAFAEDENGENKGYQNFRLFKSKKYETSIFSERFSSSTVSITRDDVEEMKEKLDGFHEEVVGHKNEITSTNALVEVYECLSDVYDLVTEISVESAKLGNLNAKLNKSKKNDTKTQEINTQISKTNDNIKKYEENLKNIIQQLNSENDKKEDKKESENFNLKEFQKECKENIFDPWKKEYENLCSEWYNIDTESKFIKHSRTVLNYANAFWPTKLTQMLTKAI